MFGHAEDFLGTTLLGRPIVLSPLIGLVLGDPGQGIMIGATLELIFMGNIKVGAAIPPDVITGGVLGTTLAIISGKGAAIALALAIPISVLAEMVISSLFIFRSLFNKRFIRYAEDGNLNKVQWLHIGLGLLKPLLMGALTFAALELGTDTMKSFLHQIPAWVNSGLQVAGNMLPALGFALLMNVMYKKDVAPYFFLGFILSSYLKMPMIAIGGLGVVVALIMTRRMGHNSEDDPGSGSDNQVTGPVLTAKEINGVFLRSMALEANFNFETCQNTGFAFSMVPVLRKLYHTRDSMAAALKRHLQFFNTSPYGSTLILGITSAMEQQNSASADFDSNSINTVKLGLMGPLAGVFDSLFWGTLRVIAAGIGTSLALKGNIAGPVLFILIFNVPHLVLRYYLTIMGYRQGNKFLQKIAGSNVMDRLTGGAAIVGLMVVGAMPALLMPVKTPLEFFTNGTSSSLQSILDQIIPNLIPLGLTLLVYFLLKRNVRVTYLLLGLLALGFFGSLIHVFA